MQEVRSDATFGGAPVFVVFGGWWSAVVAGGGWALQYGGAVRKAACFFATELQEGTWGGDCHSHVVSFVRSLVRSVARSFKVRSLVHLGLFAGIKIIVGDLYIIVCSVITRYLLSLLSHQVIFCV